MHDGASWINRNISVRERTGGCECGHEENTSYSFFLLFWQIRADIGSMSFHTYLLLLWCFFRPRIPLTSALSSRCYGLQGGEGQLDIRGGQRRPPTKSSPRARSLWRGHLRHSDDALCVHHLQTAGIWFIIWFLWFFFVSYIKLFIFWKCQNLLWSSNCE